MFSRTKCSVERDYIMSEAKIFNNGESQVVILPKECRFDLNQKVIIKKIGYMVVMVPEDIVNRLFESGSGSASPVSLLEGRLQDFQEEKNRDY